MMSDIMTTVKGWLGTAKAWWGTLTLPQKYTVGAIASVAFIAYAGGMVLQGFLIGAMVNACFWIGFWSPKMVSFMQKAGWLIDLVITVGVFAIGGAHGMIAGLFIAGIFSIARRNLIPPVVKLEVVSEVKPVEKLEVDNV